MDLATSFGSVAQAYDLGRSKHAPEVLEYILSLIDGRIPVLDIGCGTGIATRQLAERISSVYGCDTNEDMIRVARERHPSGIYSVAPAHNLPFASDMFGAVTAFSCFHWFCNNTSAQEIKRVLQPGGVFVVISRSKKKEEGALDYERVIAKLRGTLFSYEQSVEAVRARYNPLEVLTEAGFSAVSQRSFLIPQTVTLDQELSHLATRSYVLAIPELERPEILRKLEAHLKAEYSSGCITRVLDPFVVYGRK